jgi:alkyl hydroperoxide reductase subunit AhpC
VATLQLGDEAPNFTAETTAGPIDFHGYLGNGWGILFSHPADFTPVCTTELGAVAKLVPEFAKRNTKVAAVSVDPLDSHTRWLGDIEDVTGARPNYPLIADPDRTVATSYGMIHPNAGTTATVRSVFVIGPDKKVKLTLTYPASTGRDFGEILRVLDSLQLTAAYQVATPADWRAGDDVVITTAVSDADAAVRFPGYTTVKPYLRTTAQPA